MTLDIEKWAKNRDYTIPSPLSSAKEISGRHSHRPAGTSIRWPAMYRELRKKGYSKRKAAMISNGKWRKKHGLPPKSRGTVELAKQSTNRSASSRRLNTHPRGTLSQLIKDEPIMLNSSDFPFAQSEILKAGTRAGAIKGWITRRRNAGISPSQIDSEGRAKYGKDWDTYGAQNNMGRSTRGVPAARLSAAGSRASTGGGRPTIARNTRAQRLASQRKSISTNRRSRPRDQRIARAKVEALTPIILAGDKDAKAKGLDYDKAGDLTAENVRAQYNGKVVSSAAGIASINGMYEVMVFDDIETPDGSMNDSQFVVGRFSSKAKAESVKKKYTTTSAPKKKPAAKKPAAKKTGNPMEYKFTGKNADLDDDNWSLLSLRHERQMTLDGDPEAQGFDIDAIDAKMAQIRIMYDDPTRPMPESMADRAARGGPSVGSQMASAPIDSSPRMSNDLPKKSPGVNKAVASANARLKAKGIRHRITRNDIDRVARDSVYDDGTTQAELDEMGMTRDIVQRDVDEARKNIIRHLTSGRTGPFKDFMDELVDSDDLLSAMAILTDEGRGRTYSIA